ncbi:serine/threonine-protein kinase STY17 [Pelomyxa schiedti]|nr:serine/threonine-protein kinase STY17 [Pelomyxa schiedti]
MSNDGSDAVTGETTADTTTTTKPRSGTDLDPKRPPPRPQGGFVPSSPDGSAKRAPRPLPTRTRSGITLATRAPGVALATRSTTPSQQQQQGGGTTSSSSSPSASVARVSSPGSVTAAPPINLRTNSPASTATPPPPASLSPPPPKGDECDEGEGEAQRQPHSWTAVTSQPPPSTSPPLLLPVHATERKETDGDSTSVTSTSNAEQSTGSESCTSSSSSTTISTTTESHPPDSASFFSPSTLTRNSSWDRGLVPRSASGAVPLRKELFLKHRTVTPAISNQSTTGNPSATPSTTTSSPLNGAPSSAGSDEAATIEIYKQQVQSQVQREVETVKAAMHNREKLQQLLVDAVEGKKTMHNEIDPSHLSDIEVIARGAAAKVFRAKYQPPGKGSQVVAIKHYSEDYLNFDVHEFRKEVVLMSILSHRNLACCVGACTQSLSKLYLVTPFFPFTLDRFINHIAQANEGQVDILTISALAIDIASGMNYLHSLGLIHRDLKSSNILVTEDGTAKVIDFGTVRVVDRSLMTGNLGTVQYMAPELFASQKYTEKADVYSFAIVMWEMLTRQIPYSDKDSWAIPLSVAKGDRPPIPKDCHPAFSKLIKQCWHSNQTRRPSFHDALHLLSKMTQESGAKTLRRAATVPESGGKPAPNEDNETVVISKFLLDFSIINDAYPLNSTLEDQFYITNNTSHKIRLKIDKVATNDYQISFVFAATVLEPKSFKKVQVKLNVLNKTNTIAKIPITLGENSNSIEAIIRCDAGLFGVNPQLLELAEDKGLSIPRLLVHLGSALQSKNGFRTKKVFLRAAPDSTEVRKTKELLNFHPNEHSSTLAASDTHTIACLIKLWFRELPEPTLQNIELTQDMDAHDVSKCVNLFSSQCTDPVLSACSRWLFRLLAEAISHPETDLTPFSVAAEMAPNLFRVAAPSIELAHILTQKSAQFIECMIQNELNNHVATPETPTKPSTTPPAPSPSSHNDPATATTTTSTSTSTSASAATTSLQPPRCPPPKPASTQSPPSSS